MKIKMARNTKNHLLFLTAIIVLLWHGFAGGQENILTVGNGSGSPGSVNNEISISLTNQDTVAGLILTVGFDPSILTPSNVTTVDRTQNQSGLNFNIPDPGELLITLFDFAGDDIDPASGEIIQILFDVNAASSQGQSVISIIDAALASTDYESLSTILEEGSFTVTGTQALTPPLNLSAQVTGNIVTLSWESPTFNKGSNRFKHPLSHDTIPQRRMPEIEWNTLFQKNALHRITEIILDEIEPNNTLSQAQILTGDSIIQVNGSAETMDTGDLFWLEDDIEDLFFISLLDNGLDVFLTNFTSDCDLYLYEILDTENIRYAGSSLIIGATYPEAIVNDTLQAGDYLIGVSIYDPDPLGSDTTSYHLTAEGKFNGGDTTSIQSYNIYRSTSPNAINTGFLLYNIDASTHSVQDQPPTSETYYYQVTAVYNQGESTPSNEVSVSFASSVEQNNEPLPDSYRLFQNYPNPFNPETMIQYALPKAGHVILTIFSISGKEVATLKDAWVEPGRHSIAWDGKDNNNLPVAGGIYLCRMQADEYQRTIRLLLLK